jgi:cAMP-dependent protein kinase regulator
VTADSADSNNNIVSNDDIKKEDVVVDEGDGSENDSPTITKKKSYKVKRIISTDSFKRENPGVAFNGSSTSLDLNDVKGSQHSVGINDGNNDDDTDQKPRRSWNVKRIMTQDSFARENPDHHFFASKRSLGSNDSHSSILSTSLHGESGSQCRFMSRSSSSSSLHEIDVGGHRVKAMQQLLQHRWSSAQRLGEERPTLKSKSAHNTLWRNKADTSTTRRIGDAASESNRHLMTTKTSHPPLKKYTFLKSQDEHPQAASQKKTKWNSRHSEASSACGLDFGTTHSVTSFASSCESGLEEDDIQTDTDQPNSTHCDIPPHTPQSSLQKKVGLANRISQFEEMNDNIESKNQAGSILSPRYLEPKDKFQPSRSTYGKSPGSLRAMTKNRFVRIGASMTSDAQPTDDDRETASPGVSNSATATTKGSQSLRDKISMFNKAGTLPEFMTVFGSTSPSIGQKKLIAKPASLSSSSSKRELRRSSALGHIKGESSLETSLLELLPPPKNSLDVKNNQRKSDKTNGSVANSESHESFGRRVRLKSTKSALVGKNNQSKRNIFTAIAAPKIDDLTDFQPPEFEKDRDSIQQIDSALRKNFVFNEMNEDERERFVKAFEEVVFEKGQIIIKQGDVGDYFYVIASGEVSYEVNKKNVGSAASGDSFGELSLLYTCPRNASVIAESPSTRLFRVDQRTFRFMMQSQTNDLEESKKKLLRGIKFLEHLSDEDLVRLSSVMTPCIFTIGDYLVKRGEKGDSFYILHEGKVRLMDIVVGNNRYEDVTLHTGDYFGEGALISSETRTANAVAVTKGTAFSIDRSVFQRVLGDFITVIRKAQDRRRLVSLFCC